MRRSLLLFPALALLALPAASRADVASGIVTSVCGTPQGSYTAGRPGAQQVDTNGNICIAVAAGATANPPVAILSTPTTSAAQLASNKLTNGVIFYIPTTNTGTICVGKDNTITVGGASSWCMSVASGITAGSLGVSNTNLIWVISSNGTDKIQFLGN